MNVKTQIGMKNLQRIQFDKFEEDFSFIVNGKIYKTNSFVASILSPKVWRMFKENMKISYYQINTDCEGDFNQIIEYGKMKIVDISQKERKYFKNVMIELGNSDEFLRFSKKFEENISYENALERLKIKKKMNSDFKEEIDFISSNFHAFYSKYPEAIFSLDVDVIEQIISSGRLKIQNEKELFDIIFELYTKSKEYSTLFSYVIFMNLSSQSIQKFIQNFDINDINNSIWEKIRERFQQDISKESGIAYQQSHKELLINRYIDIRYESIFQYLSEQCHGNVYTKKIVDITSSSDPYESRNIENIVQSSNSYYATSERYNSWIQFDFKERKVLIDHYTLQTFDGNGNCEHLRSWVLEVSNDGKNYTVIDRCENSDCLRGSYKQARFCALCLSPQRFIRLRQIGVNWRGTCRLCLKQIDFSGMIYE